MDGSSEEKKVVDDGAGGKIVTEIKTEANGDFAKVTLTQPNEGKSTIVTVDKKTERTVVQTYQVTGEKEIALQRQITDSKKENLVVPQTIKVNDTTYKVTSIAKNAFKGNDKLTSANTGSNVKTIGAGAFSKNTKLTSATLGKNVKSIGAKAFDGDAKLKTITIQSAKLTKVGKKAFDGIAAKATIRIKGSKKQFNATVAMIQKSGIGKKVRFKRI